MTGLVNRTLITPEGLEARLAEPGIVILDTRFDLTDPESGRRAHAAAHLPGAVYVHLDTELAGPVTPASGRHPLPDPQHFARIAGGWGVGPDSQVVVYDEGSGAIAARAWWMLRWLGHADVAVLDGGFAAWRKAGGPLTQSMDVPDAKSFQPGVSLTATVSTEEVRREIGQDRFLLVDARARERFMGVSEPLDSIAGHIPGASNRPFVENLSKDGRWLDASQLRARWESFLDSRSPGTVASMCGSGVTACHNLLALEHAGLHGARLYPGSWSEWIRDPLRPVATGK